MIYKTNINDLFDYQRISVENHYSNGGYLKNTFFEAISLIPPEEIPQLLTICNDEDIIIGYCLYHYTSIVSIKIDQICLDLNYQNKEYGKECLDYLKNHSSAIIAYPSLGNEQAYRFFSKNGFSLTLEDSLTYYQATYLAS